MKAAFLAKPGFSFNEENKALKSILSSFDSVICFDKVDETKGYVGSIESFVDRCIADDCDVFVTAGGDGIASYTASAIIRNPSARKPGILAYPAGTANAGPIVKATSANTFESFHKVTIDAIQVSCGEKVLGYAFNDVIIGNSFLGTLDGRFVNLDAIAMAKEGKAVETVADPSITGKDFCVKVNGKEMELSGAAAKPAQICASTLQFDRIDQRAIFGGLMASVGEQHPAAISFMDRIAVDSRPETWGFKGLSCTSQICFGPEDTIVLSGFTDKGQIIIDGNPFVRQADEIELKCTAEAITAYWS